VVIEEFGHPRKILGFDDIVIWFFTSSDGAKLLRAHRNLKESKSKSSNVLAIFMETSDSFNVFGSVMDFVVGDEVKKVFNNHKHWSKVVEFLQRNEINVSQEDTKKLFNQALNRETVFAYFKRLTHQLFSRGSQAVFMTLSDNFSLIAKGIQGFKYDAKDWDNSNPEFSSKNAPFIFVRYQKYDTTTLEKVRLKNTTEIKAKFKESIDLINAHKSKLPDTIRIPLENFIQLAEQKSTLFFELFKENHTKFLKVLDLGNEVLNAFVCGFIDGFIDILAFVFSLFDYAFKAIGGLVDYTVNQGFYWGLLLEYIENAIQALSKFDFLDFAKKIISLPLETLSKFVTFIQNISLPNINFTKVGYFGGYIVFGIVQIALEILFTKGTATLERIFAKGASIIQGGIKRVLRFGDDVFAALSFLIKQIEKGADNFAAYISKIIDDIFKWLEDLFRSGKGDEVLEGLKEIGSGGILKYFEVISRNMVAQEHNMSCAAACIRQLAKDYGIEIEEKLIREFARTTKQTGTFPDGILDGLKKVFKDKEIEAGMFYDPKISDIDMAKSISKDGSWISIIRPNSGKSHAIIIDKIENGKVIIRDPWPIEGIGKGSGVEAIITEAEFAKIWAQGGNYAFKVK
jgi:predicted double-glycine peptidase